MNRPNTRKPDPAPPRVQWPAKIALLATLALTLPPASRAEEDSGAAGTEKVYLLTSPADAEAWMPPPGRLHWKKLHQLLDEKAAQLIAVADRKDVDPSLHLDIEGLRLFASNRDCLAQFQSLPREGAKRITSTHPRATFDRAFALPDGPSLEANPPRVDWTPSQSYIPRSVSQKFWINNTGSEATSIESIALEGAAKDLFELADLPSVPKTVASSLGFTFSVTLLDKPPDDDQWHAAEVVLTRDNGPPFKIPLSTKQVFWS